MTSAELFGTAIANGLLLGGIYVLAALGLTLVFGIMDIINIAHGHMMIVGSYIAILLFTSVGLTPLVGMFLAMAILFVFGIAIYRLFLERIDITDLEQPILVLFGVALVLQNLANYFFSGRAQTAGVGFDVEPQSIGFLTLSAPRLIAAGAALVLATLTWVFIYKTKTGSTIRATAQNPTAAKYVGIDVKRTYLLSMGVGSSLAGASGALLAMLFPIDPYLGWHYLLKAFAVVVLGGVGSVFGTFVGGLTLGVAENVGELFLGGSLRHVISFGVFLLVLLVKPEGLFGEDLD